MNLKEAMGRYCLVIYSLLLLGTVQAQSYNEGVVIFKVLPQYRSNCYKDSVSLPQLKNVYNEVQGTSIKKIFPNHQPPSQQCDTVGRKLVDISLIYKMEFPTSNSVDVVVEKIWRTGTVEYADKDFIYQTMYQPNDPISQPVPPQPWVIPNQNFLQIIKAQQAWDITKGDPSVVIGIVDTYFQITHPDLAGKIALNTADPIDGIDNDLDGYTDNYYGWHSGFNHWDVSAFYYGSHGTAVAGSAAAHTDNGVGVAATGFNSRFLPVAGMNFPGIVYAADHGAKIINLSWGGGGSISSYGNDIIDYAAINHDVVVVAAAGNTHANIDFYPASFNNVLSVAASNANTATPVDWPIDVKTSWATWSNKIDIMAPGNGVATTTDGSGYDHGVGTSFSSPVVAGAAALVRWRYPFLKEYEVRELLKSTSDNVYSVSGTAMNNMDYFEMLGKGRLNMEQALSCDPTPVNFYNCAKPALRVINKKVLGLCGSTIPATPVTLDMDFRNSLGNSAGVTIQVSTTDSDVTMNTSTNVLGAMSNQQTANNVQFTFTVNPLLSTPFQKVVTFRIQYTYVGGYTDYEYIDVLLETKPTYSFIYGPSNICYDYRAGVYYSNYMYRGPGATYSWTIPSGSTIVSGAGTNAIILNLGPQGGDLSLTITTSNGCVWTETKTIQIMCPPSVTYTNAQSSNNSLPANTRVTQFIHASGNVVVNTGTAVEFHANNYIVLEPGFRTEVSSTFVGDTYGCTYCFNYKVATPAINQTSVNVSTDATVLPPEEGINRLEDPSLMIDVYPTPSTGTVTIRSKTPMKEIIVSNLYGVTIEKVSVEDELYEQTIDLKNHEPGLYTIQVNDGINTYGDKVLLVR